MVYTAQRLDQIMITSIRALSSHFNAISLPSAIVLTATQSGL